MIVSVPDHCLSFYFEIQMRSKLRAYVFVPIFFSCFSFSLKVHIK